MDAISPAYFGLMVCPSNGPLMNFALHKHILSVSAISQQLLVGFQKNFMGTFSNKGECALIYIICMFWFDVFFSSPEPKAPGELII